MQLALGVQPAYGVQLALRPALETAPGPAFILDWLPIAASTYVKSKVAAFPAVATLVSVATFDVPTLASLVPVATFLYETSKHNLPKYKKSKIQ